MKRIPPWLTWSALAVVLWCGWRWGVYAPMQRRDLHWYTEGSRLQQQHVADSVQLAAAPSVVARNDSVLAMLRGMVAGFATSVSVESFVGHLAATGRRDGIVSVDVSPDLTSLMRLPQGTVSVAEDRVALDTLLVQVSATGGFRAIGEWLDAVEARSDFQYWRYCHWQQGEEDGSVEFKGTAAFWVAAAGTGGAS